MRQTSLYIGSILGDDFISIFNDFTINCFHFKDCFSYQLFLFFHYFFTPAIINIIRCYAANYFEISLTIIPVDEPGYFLFECFWKLPEPAMCSLFDLLDRILWFYSFSTYFFVLETTINLFAKLDELRVHGHVPALPPAEEIV